MNTQEWNPGQLLEVSGYYWKTCTLHAAVKLDLFTALGSAGQTGRELALKLELDERALTMLLNALTAMDLLVKHGDKYSNTDAAASLLAKDSPRYLGHIIKHHHHLVDSWSQLDQAVKTGHPVRGRVSHGDAEWRESFLMGMFNLAMNLAPQVVAGIDLSNRRHLLDLGGGPGTYAIHFCLANPQLRATVYDLPTTRPFAETTIERFGLKDRIEFMDGDYLAGVIAGRYDVAWLSHILHGEGLEDCRKIVDKAVSVLDPGGIIMIHEFILKNTMDGPLFPALFSLNMLLGTPQGQSYSEEQIAGILARGGVRDIRRLPFQGTNDSGIMVGTV